MGREGIMTRLLLWIVFLGLAARAEAEFQIDIDPGQLPQGMEIVAINACFNSPNGIPLGCYDAVVSGPSGTPAMYHVVWAIDSVLNQAWVSSITLDYLCGDVIRTSSLAPGQYEMWYFPGPANPPVAPTGFPGIDPNMQCRSSQAEDLPVDFALNPAFPNPFNPSTTIRFTLPTAEFVRLTVFDLAGRQMATLANEMLARGTHDMIFDASALGSGVYMVTIEAGNSTATRKVLLLK